MNECSQFFLIHLHKIFYGFFPPSWFKKFISEKIQERAGVQNLLVLPFLTRA